RIENGCAIASVVIVPIVDTSFLRSTAQKSQPTFDGLSSAASHGVLHAPIEHTSSAGQSITGSPPVPSWLQRYTVLPVSPAQYSSSGGQTTQPAFGSHTWSGPQGIGSP